ncbi:hypothetical protein [Pseudarthrobacter quantipunctorum]|uniref:Gram-positive cocci surface proteins LPxTG domain-containing protein n=1 Tax=Pseudarthrobacter quantipunctorum TaxID=3128980 RepID=A0ABZ2R7G1_9MICC
MTMFHNRSEILTSRTGIHGGVRRGTAAAAVGAVLVLAAGVPASLGDEGDPQPGSTSAPSRQDAPSQDPGGKEAGRAPRTEPRKEKTDDGGRPTREAAAPSPVPSTLSAPAPLLPAVTASLAPSAAASPLAVPSTPLPLPPDVPEIPSATLPATAVPVPSLSSPGTLTGSPAPSAPAQPTPAGTPTGAPVPSSEPGTRAEQPAADLPGTEHPGIKSPSTEHPATAQPGAVQPGIPGDGAPPPAAGPEAGAGTPGAPGAAEAAQPDQAREPGGRTPQAEGTLPGSRQRVGSYISTQPELQAATIGLGLGLVGLAAGAGVIYLRLRKP